MEAYLCLCLLMAGKSSVATADKTMPPPGWWWVGWVSGREVGLIHL